MLDRLRRRGGDGHAAASGPAAMVDAAFAAIGDRYLAEREVRAIPAVAAVLDAPEPDRGALLIELARRRLGASQQAGSWSMLSMLGRRRVVLSPSELREVVELIAGSQGRPGNGKYLAVNVLEMTAQAIERTCKELPASDTAAVRDRLRAILAVIDGDNGQRLTPAARKRLLGVAEIGVASDPLDAITRDDNLGPALRAVFEPHLAADAGATPFVAHIVAATRSGKATPKWLDATRVLAAPYASARELVRGLLAAALSTDDGVARYDYTAMGQGVHETARFTSPTNEAILRNVVWAAAALGDAETLPQLRALTTKCIQMIGGQFGYPRSLAVALACPAAIGAMAAPGSLGTLQALQRSVRHGSVLREINKAIDALAASADLSRSELLETAVEDHELDPAGERSLPVGDWTAVIRVEPTGAVMTTWRDPGGATRGSAPKAVRDANADAAKAVAALVKEIRTTVATERDRLDRLFLEDRRWPLEQWRERYLAHPITGALASSLVWRFTGATGEVVGIPARTEATVSTEAGASVEAPADAEVRLWHPVEASDATVGAWRALLLARRQGQALKQVFRETYTITPAERETATYSNRFARHIIRQNQVRALMKGRGWAPVPVAWWDDGIDHGVSRRKLEAYGLRVEFFFDPITDFQPTSGDMWPYCTTDQVRFFEAVGDRAVALADVPPIAFSEVMRDVDLFVGVTTIGADPEWLDRGERTFDTYWNSWGFGDLSAAAKVRHQVIETILPALTIADRCSLSERFLEVRGQKRSYKIHLGSSNILMSPSDRYLCIVAARHPAEDRLFLPFDDDPTLSLILSKAFLLADDAKITDPTIVSQIDGG